MLRNTTYGKNMQSTNSHFLFFNVTLPSEQDILALPWRYDHTENLYLLNLNDVASTESYYARLALGLTTQQISFKIKPGQILQLEDPKAIHQMQQQYFVQLHRADILMSNDTGDAYTVYLDNFSGTSHRPAALVCSLSRMLQKNNRIDPETTSAQFLSNYVLFNPDQNTINITDKSLVQDISKALAPHY